MKRARFVFQGRVHWGTVADDGTLLDEGGRPVPAGEVMWLPPVEPRKLLAVALNYMDHAEELNMKRPVEPVVFLKPPTSLIGHRSPILYPKGATYMHYEGELAVVIGAPCRRVPAERALDYVRGWTAANDVTVRDFIHKDTYRPPVKAKGFDTFGPLGPWLVERGEDGEIPRWVRTYVNGELRQDGSTADLIFSIPELIAYLSDFMTLEPGDVILTGTPKGISPVKPGDVVRVEVDGVGALENPIVAEDEAVLAAGPDR